MRLLRILGWVVVVLVVLVIAAGAALWVAGGPALAWLIQNPGSALVGRQIKIGGPVKIAWGAPTHITIDDLHVANASWGSEPDMFSARRLDITLFARTLVFGPTRIPLIALDGAKLLLEKSKDGQVNWKLSSGTPKKRHEFPDLEKFLVHDGALRFHNGVTNAHTEVDIADLEYDAPNPDSPIHIGATGKFQKAPVRLAGTVAPLKELRDTAHPYPVTLYGALDQSQVVVDGTIAEPLEFAGVDLRLSLSGTKLADLASRLGVPLPPLPDFRATGELTGGEDKWEIKALSVSLGHSDLEGGLAIDIPPKKVPQITANLTSSFIDIADFTGLYGQKPATSSAPAPRPDDKSGRIIPDTAIAVHKLPGIDAELSFYGTRIKRSGGVPLEKIAIGLGLHNGELELKPFRFHIASGDVDFNMRFTPPKENAPPRLQGDINIQHIDLHQLLSGPSIPAMLKQTAGVAGGFVKLETTGVSLREFLANMDGDVGIFMEHGQLSALLDQLAPIDVLGALGVYLRGDHPVPIDCIVSRFDVKRGVATATTLLLATPDVIVNGAGNLNFGSETITLKLIPYNKHATAVSLRTPVDIGGTFGKPEYHLETGRLVERLGAAIGLGIVFPPAALAPLVDTGLGESNACGQVFAAQGKPGNPQPQTGSSTPRR